MRRLLLVASLAIGFALASPAAGAVWNLVWSSVDSLNSGVTTGDSLATITPETTAFGPSLDLAFSTPAGQTAHLTVVNDPSGPFAFGTVPLHVPDPNLFPGSVDGWALHGVGPVQNGYSWTGPFDTPDTFLVHAFNPGSGPDPRQVFDATGTLVTAQAAEPSTVLTVLAGLAVVMSLRRRRPS